jgi:hypothetical protein
MLLSFSSPFPLSPSSIRSSTVTNMFYNWVCQLPSGLDLLLSLNPGHSSWLVCWPQTAQGVLFFSLRLILGQGDDCTSTFRHSVFVFELLSHVNRLDLRLLFLVSYHKYLR